MKKIAIYGKGGIGKSTVTANLSAALADKGYKVMHIGCDPKADSTSLLLGGREIPGILEVMKEKKEYGLEDIIFQGYKGILCTESGGPTPGIGCAGRGIIAAFEALENKGAYEVYKPDVVLYDVLGDVVCGGFAVPLRKGYADKVFIVTSGEKMSLFAARNIAMALENFNGRGYATLGGFILNSRNVVKEFENVQSLAQEIESRIVMQIPRDAAVQACESINKTVVEGAPDSAFSSKILSLAEMVLE